MVTIPLNFPPILPQFLEGLFYYMPNKAASVPIFAHPEERYAQFPRLPRWGRWPAVGRDGEGLSVHRHVSNRVTPEVWVYRQGNRLVIVSGHWPPCLPRWGRWHGVSRDGEGLSVQHHVSNRVTPQRRGSTVRITGSNCQRPLAAPLRRKSEIFASSPIGRAKLGAFCFGASVSGGFAVPHPSRLRRATFPPGEGFFSPLP